MTFSSEVTSEVTFLSEGTSEVTFLSLRCFSVSGDAFLITPQRFPRVRFPSTRKYNRRIVPSTAPFSEAVILLGIKIPYYLHQQLFRDERGAAGEYFVYRTCEDNRVFAEHSVEGGDGHMSGGLFRQAEGGSGALEEFAAVGGAGADGADINRTAAFLQLLVYGEGEA